MEILLEIMVFVLGLCVGSFINMAVYRLARRYKIINYQLRITNENRSFCDYCGQQLKWFDNIPVLSWLVFSGKSRCCGKRLPLTYPAVEIIMAILFLLNFSARGGSAYGGQFSIFNFQSIFNYLILGLLVFEAAFDFKYMMLPDATAWALIGLATIKWAVSGFPVNFLVSGIVSAIFIFVLHKIKIKGEEAMGDGDIFLAGFMGLFLGFPKIVVAFYVAFIVGAIIGGSLILLKKVKKNTPIPFGPFLIFGVVVAMWWGEAIIKLIL